MSTENNVAVTTEAVPSLKSTDTSIRASLKESAPSPAPEPVKEVNSSLDKEEARETHKVKSSDHDDSPDAPEAASPQENKQKRLPRWMKERLERERQVTEARTREAVLREIQESKANQQHTNAVNEEPRMKTLEDFDFNQDKFTDYLVDHKLSKREEEARLKSERERHAKASQDFKARIDAFEERAGDGTWQDIVDSPINMDPSYKALTDLFIGDDHDLDIAHYLATNLKEAERIKGLSRLQQVREISKLADKFDGSSQAAVSAPATAPIPKKTTSAPPPPKTVSGSGKPSVDINDPGLSTAQRIAAWRKARKG